ncbi:MAG: hypothetical protein IPK46_12260 [Saprospiraceae bacterium]|nr:hypothetical protein [Saprospiraceae bacterium]
MNALLRKALGLLALMMIAGMAYIATTSHGSQATLPSISLDEFSTKLGQRCQYASFQQYKYLGFSRAGGPSYVWNRTNDKVLIIAGADSIVLDARNQTARRAHHSDRVLASEMVTSLAKNWQVDLLACLGTYSHLMEADSKSFITSFGNARIKAILNEPNSKGCNEVVWEISPLFDPLSCTTYVSGDSLKISWQQWSNSPDSIRWAPSATINNRQVVYSNVTASRQLISQSSSGGLDF